MDSVPRPLIRIWEFLRLLISRFIADKGMPNAASLTFTTLLSLVPLMTVILAIFSAFPVSDKMVLELQDFVFDNFVPASGEVVEQYLLEFSSKASRLTGVGFAFLLLVAVMMMINIDHAINDIWRVRRKRSPLSMFVIYWAVITLGPLMIGLSLAATSYLISMPLFSEAMDPLGIKHRVLAFMPLLAAAIAFTLLYAVVPNRKVPFLHALAGGVLAALLFELAKRGFAIYVTNFPTYEAIYGALAVVPIFLVWIYLSWGITLLGAEFSYCLGVFRDRGWHGVQGEGGDLVLAFRLLRSLWLVQAEGRALSTPVLAQQMGYVPEERLEALLEQLAEARLLLRTEQDEWALARDLSRITLSDLYRVRGFVLPASRVLSRSDHPADLALHRILGRLETELEDVMGVPLDALFSSNDSQG